MLGCVGVKLNVVQKRWLCVSACTSFNFFEAWFFVRSMSARSFNRVTDNGLGLASNGGEKELTSTLFRKKAKPFG